MIGVLQLRAAADESEADFYDQAQTALRLLAARPGFVRGSLGRATDDDSAWLLLTEWESAGSYRRGLGAYEVKLVATPLLTRAEDRPSAFESLLSIDSEGVETVRVSDRADDADWVSRTSDD